MPESLAFATIFGWTTEENIPLILDEHADPEKGIPAARRQLETNDLELTDENLFIVATCKEKGLSFLKGQAEIGVRKIEKEKTVPPVSTDASANYNLSLNGRSYSVSIDGNTAVVNGKTFQVELNSISNSSSPSAETSDQSVAITAEMPGKVIRLLVDVGTTISEGDSLLVLEAMKMEMPISATTSGTLTKIYVSPGDQVAAGDTLALIS